MYSFPRRHFIVNNNNCTISFVQDPHDGEITFLRTNLFFFQNQMYLDSDLNEDSLRLVTKIGMKVQHHYNFF